MPIAQLPDWLEERKFSLERALPRVREERENEPEFWCIPRGGNLAVSDVSYCSSFAPCSRSCNESPDRVCSILASYAQSSARCTTVYKRGPWKGTHSCEGN